MKIMLNARTWHRLCISAYVMFPAIVIAWVLPKDSPFAWPEIGIWSLFYLFAAAFPIGFAIQESGKQKTQSEQGLAPNRSLPPSQNSTSSVRGSED
ncbi:MAG: hypothetical protein NTW21_17785 [Verrucomicrobia bacterium]|nr:hypothetical protein [Verrucomicrobiota bacterium]